VSDATWQALPREGEEVSVEGCGENRPVLVRHAAAILDEDGESHDVLRPVVAVCTCGKSQRRPWCDSTHKALRR
jgi:CDGSH-type Zn-finger protein